jgi:hypothetical protein
VHDKLVHFLEAAVIQQVMNPLPCGHLALFVLLVNAVLTAPHFRFKVSAFQFLYLVFNVHLNISSDWVVDSDGAKFLILGDQVDFRVD